MTVDVSVVVPVWQPRPDWLRTALDSALAERHVAVEVVVVDDGCEVPVQHLLNDVDDPRVRICRVAHGGVSAARNAGTAAARGRFIRFLDADDAIVRGSTARLAALASTGAVAYGATTFCDEDLHPLWTMRARQSGHLAELCLLSRVRARLQGMLFPREALEAAGPWDETMDVLEDWDLVLRVLEHAPMRADPAVAGLYRRHPAGASADADTGLANVWRIIDGYLARHPEARGGSLERRARAMAHAHAARVELSHGRPGPAVGRLGRALAVDPRAVGHELAAALPALRAAGGRR